MHFLARDGKRLNDVTPLGAYSDRLDRSREERRTVWGYQDLRQEPPDWIERGLAVVEKNQCPSCSQPIDQIREALWGALVL